MERFPEHESAELERQIMRRLRLWIIGVAAVCLVIGISLGALLSGRPAVAQNDATARTPEALSASFADIARRVEPSVVKISTVTVAENQLRRGGRGGGSDEESEIPPDNPLFEMFRQRRAPRGVGSGFIVDPRGFIITNKHVVDDATRIIVQLQSGERLRARLIGADEETDLAVIKVDVERELPAVRLGNSDEISVGDWVLAIGSPFDLDQTVTAGIISTKERANTPGARIFQRFIQTDAAINRGNSGGPLVNMRGEVIGINSQIATTTGDYNGVGFALPSNEATFVYRQIVDGGGRVRRGYLGIYLQPVRGELARVYNLPETRGAIITDTVEATSPAGRGGLRIGDIIIGFNGQPIADHRELINRVATTPIGTTVQLEYLRETGGNNLERRTASVTLGERPVNPDMPRTERPTREPNTDEETNDETTTPPNNNTGTRPRLGLTVSELTPQLAAERGLRDVRGLFVSEVDAGSLIEDVLIQQNLPRQNWVIERINRTPVTTRAEFERIINALRPGDPIVLSVAYMNGGRLVHNVVQFTYQ
jgi:serine protease Do